MAYFRRLVGSKATQADCGDKAKAGGEFVVTKTSVGKTHARSAEHPAEADERRLERRERE